MSTSETITRTDLTNILNEVLPPMWGMVTKVKTLTATTDANGNVSLGLSASAVSVVVCVIGESSAAYVYAPFVYGGNWYAKVMSSNSSHTAITNTSVSIIITYLQAAPYSTADYIVEQGTSGIWTYRKWNSGVSECWGRYSYSITSTTTWGSMYYTPAQTVNFPTSLFNAVPTVSLATANSGVVGWGGANNISSSSVAVFIYRPTSASNGTVIVDIMAKGTWK